MNTVIVLLVAFASLFLIMALRARRRARADGMPERSSTYRARRFMCFFESGALSVLALIGIGMNLGASSDLIVLLDGTVAIAATIVPFLMIIFIPGLLGRPE